MRFNAGSKYGNDNSKFTFKKKNWKKRPAFCRRHMHGKVKIFIYFHLNRTRPDINRQVLQNVNRFISFPVLIIFKSKERPNKRVFLFQKALTRSEYWKTSFLVLQNCTIFPIHYFFFQLPVSVMYFQSSLLHLYISNISCQRTQ